MFRRIEIASQSPLVVFLFGGTAITHSDYKYANKIKERKTMTYLAGAGYSTVVGINHRRPISMISIRPNSTIPSRYVVVFMCRSCRGHGFSSASESAWTDFPVENAYELLGVSETSSFAEIKESFRKLAKETHPDLAESRNDSNASRRFVQILAAYEVRANHAQVYDYCC